MKDELGEEFISQSREHEQEYKEGCRENFSYFERRKRILKSIPPELDEFVKLPKRSSLAYKEKVFKKYSKYRRK